MSEGFLLSEGAARQTRETVRRVLGSGQDTTGGRRQIVTIPHTELEGILQADLAAATDEITGKKTATLKLIRYEDSANGAVLSDDEITVTNRSKAFSASNGDYLRVTWLNGEFRPLAGGGNCPPANSIWAVVIFGPPTSGTFSLKFQGQSTGTLQYNASSATIQSALEALSNISTGDVVVSGTAYSWQIEFKNDLGEQPITGLSIGSSSLIGSGVAIITYLIQQGRE